MQIESDTWATNTTETVSPEILRRTFDINFFGMVELTQLLLPLLRRAPAARIVNLTSILGSLSMHATPGSNTYNTKVLAYNTSKAAVNAFTIHLAHALKDTPIKVNAAHPG
ncbi:MAG: SDR family NAD(P)-dependent oxidoreductase, partial [Candidatus Kapaibacterium sp.]